MDKDLEKEVERINKIYGTNIVTTLGGLPKVYSGKGYSTGSLGLDLKLGGKGFPEGRHCEVLGEEAVGKTTLVGHAIADAQRQGELCAFIDTEHAISPEYMEKLGVNLGELVFSQPDYAEQALDILEAFINSGKFGLIIVDSVGALVPKKELDGEAGDATVGLLARLMSQAMRKLVPLAYKHKTTVVWINQYRAKIGSMGYGEQKTGTGGNALKYACSVRLDLKRIQTLKKGEEPYGSVIKATVKKTKVGGSPLSTHSYNLIIGEGISQESEIIDVAKDMGLIQGTGWLKLDLGDGEDYPKQQGLDNMRKWLKDNDEVFLKLKDSVLEMLKESK